MARITKHFDYLTPFSAAENEDDLKTILVLKYPKACSGLEVNAGFFARTVEEIHERGLHKLLGFETFEAFCEAKLGKTIDEVEAIVGGVRELRAKGVENPTRKQAVAAAAERTKPEQVLPHGGDRTTKSQIATCTTSKQEQRAAANGVGKRTQEKLDALARRAPELLDKVKAGELSAHRAAVQAGIVKEPTVLDRIRKLLPKLSREERAQVVTPEPDLPEQDEPKMAKHLNKSERIADLTAKVRELEERWETLWSFVCAESNQPGPAREVCARILERMSQLGGGRD